MWGASTAPSSPGSSKQVGSGSLSTHLLNLPHLAAAPVPHANYHCAPGPHAPYLSPAPAVLLLEDSPDQQQQQQAGQAPAQPAAASVRVDPLPILELLEAGLSEDKIAPDLAVSGFLCQLGTLGCGW